MHYMYQSISFSNPFKQMPVHIGIMISRQRRISNFPDEGYPAEGEHQPYYSSKVSSKLH